MSSIFEIAVKTILAPKLRELHQALAEARADRGYWIIRQIQADFPNFSGFIESLFVGTPQEVLERVTPYWPELADLPNVLVVIGEVQQKLAEEVSQQRF